MRPLPAALAVASCLAGVVSGGGGGGGGRGGEGDVAKQVVSTSWWPAGTEKKVESVGIISHGFVYMTAMMEYNDTLLATAKAELSDVRDIAEAAGARLPDLVDCLANAPRGGAHAVRRALSVALAAAGVPADEQPAVTVAEVPGEYSFFNVSISCIAALPGAARRRLSVPGAVGVAARGLLHFGAVGESLHSVLASSEDAVREAGGQGLEDVVECTAFLKDVAADAPRLRDLLARALGARGLSAAQGPALSIVQAGLEPGQAAALRCVASVPSEDDPPAAVSLVAGGRAAAAGGGAGGRNATAGGEEAAAAAPPAARAARGFVFVEGRPAASTHGGEAFRGVEKALSGYGIGLSDVVSCLFFVRDQSKVFDLFAGFYEAFNVHHPPPPTRDELEAVSEFGPSAAVLARCVAALPVAPAAAPLVPRLPGEAAVVI